MARSTWVPFCLLVAFVIVLIVWLQPTPSQIQVILCNSIPGVCTTGKKAQSISWGLPRLIATIGTLQLATGSFFLPLTTILRIFAGVAMSHKCGPFAGGLVAFFTTAAAEAGATLVNFWAIRHDWLPMRGTHVAAASVKEALASASWNELVLLANVPWITLLLAPCLSLGRFATVMAFGRVPVQASHVWAGCALRDAGAILAKGDIEAAVSQNPMVTALGLLLIVASVFGLVKLAQRAQAVYNRLCPTREPNVPVQSIGLPAQEP